MSRAAINVNWSQRVANKELYNDLPRITETIPCHWLKFSGPILRHDEEIAHSLLFWMPTNAKSKTERLQKTYKDPVKDLSIQLNRANALLFEIRTYFSPKLLRSIYFAIFDSYLSCCWFVWAQNFSSMKQSLILQKKAIRIINIQANSSHASILFKQNFILKFQDKVFLKNILFVSKSLNNLSPAIFNI